MKIDDTIYAPCETKETEDTCPYLEIKSCIKCYELEKRKQADIRKMNQLYDKAGNPITVTINKTGGKGIMKTIGDLKRDIAHLPDDTLICEDCNYELIEDETDEGMTDWRCPNEMCRNRM